MGRDILSVDFPCLHDVGPDYSREVLVFSEFGLWGWNTSIPVCLVNDVSIGLIVDTLVLSSGNVSVEVLNSGKHRHIISLGTLPHL
eukprot:2347649-Rhodomonas_salina.2